jgi:hypothetical protein
MTPAEAIRWRDTIEALYRPADSVPTDRRVNLPEGRATVAQQASQLFDEIASRHRQPATHVDQDAERVLRT